MPGSHVYPWVCRVKDGQQMHHCLYEMGRKKSNVMTFPNGYELRCII